MTTIRYCSLLLFLWTLSPLVGAAGAQSATPARRAHHALAYDDSRGRVVLTGGSTPLDGGKNFRLFNDLWEFDGSRWSQLSSSGNEMSGSGLAFDSRRNRLLSFGGFRGSPVGDFRALEKNEWKTLDESPARAAAEAGFVYDIERDRLVAFGGSAGQGAANGITWEFDGASWTRLAIASPPPRQGHAMVYDARRHRVVVFGGMGQGPAGQQPPALGDTWEFDGREWTRIDAVGPSPRFGVGATFDTLRGLVILFGGVDPTGFKGDTWSWNGVEWKKLSDTGPEPRGMGYLAYDKKRDRTVLFGGRKGYPDGDLNDTWEWDGRAWRKHANGE